MNKVILSSLALLGLSVAFVAPAQAQSAPNVLVNPTPGAASITGAASVSNMNGATSSMAVQVTFPATMYAKDGKAAADFAGTVAQNDLRVNTITVTASELLNIPTSANSFEGTAAAKLTAAGTISDQVSLIRAWRSGLN
ncbi:hypothetical protein NG799_14165 [Laspinema sp. D1]|uniref:Uncharacterized protein n=1 Tax=Laspinema palackyanum D2a TaxID=2953684 RepID=A0ABT2MRV4_9CYAN|nr:hypothetical protein [Laspinema sp. D2a]